MKTTLRVLGPALIGVLALAGCNRGSGSMTIPFSPGQPTALEANYRANPPLAVPPARITLPVPTYAGD
ncbi:hypothetical protein BVG79_02037 [Ketogulonicigenium robustum]|uniref:Lipoprotein n=1 Tax=Ketogulonicigenium robustum TaxID=92947 RepID=A0A1W6P251_9RHOB|nr:hypothetical protein [Ketogulonicigenium robustum]ARO15377.1 hypothetical protein BVG79_02037 [Ketogulonicigenium robustum]